MLRVTTKTLVGKYAQFIIENKGHFPGLTFEERTRKLVSMYYSLSKTALADLGRRAAKTKQNRQAPITPERRQPHQYAEFVKANLPHVQGKTQQEKIKRVAELWRTYKRRH